MTPDCRLFCASSTVYVGIGATVMLVEPELRALPRALTAQVPAPVGVQSTEP